MNKKLKRNLSPSAVERAREMRTNMSRAEKHLWYDGLNCHRIGFHFRRQHPVGPYHLDFYAAGPKVAVELDGMSHLGRESRDSIRDQWLAEADIHTIRISNGELEFEFGNVLRKIQELCLQRLGHFEYEPVLKYFEAPTYKHAAPGPPPFPPPTPSSHGEACS